MPSRLALPPRPSIAAAALALLLAFSAGGVWAQEEPTSEEAASQEAPEPPAPQWTLSGELSFIATAGNSESSTAGLAVEAVREAGGRGKVKLAAGGLQVETTSTSLRAVGTPADFRVIEDSTTETTAESTYLKGRYDRKISERLFWFAGAGWKRDRIAGYDLRLVGSAGVGNSWVKTERASFSTDYSLTFTHQEDVIVAPDADESFLGARFGLEGKRELTATTELASDLTLDWNLEETEDVRADFVNSLAVSINQRLALKVSLALSFDNLPALVAVDLEDASGEPTGRNVLAELEELDSTLSVALVISR